MGAKKTLDTLIGYKVNKFVLKIPLELRRDIIVLQSIEKIKLEWLDGGNKAIIEILNKEPLTAMDEIALACYDKKERKELTDEIKKQIIQMKTDGVCNYNISIKTGVKGYHLSAFLAQSRKDGIDIPCDKKGGNRVAINRAKIEDIVILREDGLMYKDIAAQLDMKVPTVISIFLRYQEGTLNAMPKVQKEAKHI